MDSVNRFVEHFRLWFVVRVLECIMFMFYRAMLGIMSGYEKVVSTSAEYVQKLHEVTERLWKEKIERFVSEE